MPVNSYKVGPGVLTFTIAPAAGVPFSAQVRSCKVTPSESVKTQEAVPMLSGDELAEEETASYKYVLAVSFQQDLSANGVIDWTWDHEGDQATFDYTPNSEDGASIDGVCRIVPIEVGGDADTRPASDVTFACIGKPTFTPGA